MTPLLTYQAIERKIEMQRSIIVGNYEFYYTAGKYKALHPELQADGSMDPMKLKQVIMESLESEEYEPADTPQKYISKLLHRYRPTQEPYNEIMQNLFVWGETGKDPFNE